MQQFRKSVPWLKRLQRGLNSIGVSYLLASVIGIVLMVIWDAIHQLPWGTDWIFATSVAFGGVIFGFVMGLYLVIDPDGTLPQ